MKPLCRAGLNFVNISVDNLVKKEGEEQWEIFLM